MLCVVNCSVYQPACHQSTACQTTTWNKRNVQFDIEYTQTTSPLYTVLHTTIHFSVTIRCVAPRLQHLSPYDSAE